MWDLAFTAFLLATGYMIYASYNLLVLLAFIAFSYIAIWLLPQLIGYYPIDASDCTWFHDTAVSKVYIQSCVITERQSLEEFTEQARTRGIGINMRFRLCIRRLIGKLYWKVEDDFTVEKHFVKHHGEVNSKEELYKLFTTFYTKTFDYKLSPWELYYIENFQENNSAFFFKSHHSLGDGLSMVSLIVNLADPFTDVSFIKIPRVSFMKQIVSYAYAFLKSPILAYESFLRKEDINCFHGPQLNGTKRYYCSESYSIQKMKVICREKGVSLNTFLVTCLGGALRKYAKSKGEDVEQLTMLIPYSMRSLPSDGSLLPMLNSTSVLVTPIQISTVDKFQRLSEYHQFFEQLKTSIDPFSNNITLKIFGSLVPLSMLKHVIHALNEKITFNFINVPGPNCELSIRGKKVKQIFYAAPTSGKVGFNIDTFSYNGSVVFGCLADDGVLKDPEHLIKLLEEELVSFNIA